MPHLTVRQAAERVGVSRQTMFRHIKEGKVSATLSHSGEKQIEITELLRAFGALQPETVTIATPSDRLRLSHRDSETPMTVTYQIELERLKAQLEFKSAELELAKERISELKAREHGVTEEKNRLLSLIEQQTRLLAAPQPEAKTILVRSTRKTASTKKAATGTSTAAKKQASVKKAPASSTSPKKTAAAKKVATSRGNSTATQKTLTKTRTK